MMVMTKAVLVAVLAGLVTLASAHKIELGQCKNIPGMAGFDPDQFAGTWYTIEAVISTSSCIVTDYTRTTEGFTVQRSRVLTPLKMVSLENILTTTGTLTIDDPGNTSKMTLGWKWDPLPDYKVTVVDTDYSQYAVVYNCQSFLFLRRFTVLILSRNKTLDDTIAQREKDELVPFGIDAEDFQEVSQDNCKEKGNADFDIDLEKMFGGGDSDGTDQEDIGFGVEAADEFENEVV